jgi:hypothetical protein
MECLQRISDLMILEDKMVLVQNSVDSIFVCHSERRHGAPPANLFKN